MSSATSRRRRPENDVNKLCPEDQPVHGWYRFVLSYPAHLVRDYLLRFGIDDTQQVLDPFCGTGTTLVACKQLGVPSVGIEATPMGHFASSVKVDWTPEPDGLLRHGQLVAERAAAEFDRDGIEDDPVFSALTKPPPRIRTLPEEQRQLLLTDSISPLPLHKTLVLADCLERYRDERYHRHELLALANALTKAISNLHFGPEVGVGPLKADAPVIEPWLAGVRRMADDLRGQEFGRNGDAAVHRADARKAGDLLEPNSISAVITSPPYPNEKDYTRTTRLESVLLGFLRNRGDLRALKKTLVCSNSRNAYQGDQDHKWVAANREIQRIADEIEQRRIHLGKTSGFERQYAQVTRLYFGGMARHLAGLRPILRPGALLAYVVGDQASYLRVMIRTGQLLAEIAQALGYDVVGIDLFRTRLATATRNYLREEVVVLRWPGGTDADFPIVPSARGARQVGAPR